jgi:hypothetical protein
LDAGQRARELDVLARLVNEVPVRRVIMSRCRSLFEFADCIRQDAGQISISDGFTC